MTLDTSKVERYVDEDYFDLDKPEDAARFEHLCNTEITKITFDRVVNDFAMKYCI